MSNLQRVEVEYVNADGIVIKRVFDRAYSAKLSYDGLDICQGAERLFIRNPHTCVNVFSVTSIESTVSDWQKQDMDREAGKLCLKGCRIQAIKAVRTTMGWDLKESKAYIDRNWPNEAKY